MKRAGLFSCIALVVGCATQGTGSGTSSGGAARCVTGAQQACACGGDQTGFQICLADGTFGMCQGCAASGSSSSASAAASSSGGASSTSSAALGASSAFSSASSGAASSSSASAGSSSSAAASGSSGGRVVIFHSDWGTATGATEQAKTDGSRWNIVGDPGGGLDVVPCTALDFPTANCLRVTARETAGGYARLARTGLGVPAAGESFWYRWYYRSEIPSTGDNSTHPVESGQMVGLDWSFTVQVQSDTTWRPELRPGGDQMDATRARWTGPLLNRGVTYRFELQIHKLNDTDFRAHLRVYDAAGALIADDDDFNNFVGGLAADPQMTLADNPDLHFRTMGGINLDEFRAGINSLVDTGYDALLFAYQGGFAVCTNHWCGPYRDGM